jgi:hypothetical protein
MPLRVHPDFLTQDLESFVPVTDADTVGIEVSSIDGEDPADLQDLRRSHEGRVGEIHGVIRVLFHQLEGALQRVMVHEPDGDPTLQDEVPEPGGTLAGRVKDVEDLCQDRDRGGERLSDILQDGSTPDVLAISGIEEGHQGTGIDQDHRFSFLWRASRTPRRVSVEGTVA